MAITSNGTTYYFFIKKIKFLIRFCIKNLKLVFFYFAFLQMHYYIGVYSLLPKEYKIIFAVLHLSFTGLTLFLLILCIASKNNDSINQKLKKNLFSSEYIQTLLYCTICKAFVKKRTRHCKKCQRCIKKYDHHCHWLGCCIGEKNLTYFHELLISNFALNTVQFIAICINISFFTSGEIDKLEFMGKCDCYLIKLAFLIIAICLLPVFIAFLCYFGYMFGFNLWLHIKDVTAYEFIAGIPPPSPKIYKGSKIIPKSSNQRVSEGEKRIRFSSRTEFPNINNIVAEPERNNTENSTNKSHTNHILPFRMKSSRARSLNNRNRNSRPTLN